MVTRVIGTTTDGGEYEWVPVFVCHRGPDGLIDRMEAFAPEDWDAALARFDELAAEAPAEPVAAVPGSTNAAMRYLEAAHAFFSDRRRHRGVRRPVVRRRRPARRPAVRRAGPDVPGRKAYAGRVRERRAETFSALTLEPLAVRGDRLALTRDHRDLGRRASSCRT